MIFRLATRGRARGARSIVARTIALATLLTLLLPTVASATPYNINWVSEAYDDSSTFNFGYQGGAYFHVNNTPLLIPNTPPGPIDSATQVQSTVMNDSFDSVLLVSGANAIAFSITTQNGDNSSVDEDEHVALTSPALSKPIPLFNVPRRGMPYSGELSINLSLAEVNPPLNKDIIAVTAAVAAEQTALDANASKVPNLAAQEQELANLQKDLAALLDEPLDQITEAQLDALLSKYSDVVSAQTRAALEQFVSDLKQTIANLQTQLALLVQQFSQLATNVANLATQGVGGGWNPDDPNNYGLTGDPSTVPDIPAPNLSQTAGAFDPNNDPYKAYADAMIARLTALATNGGIAAAQRPQFVSDVRGWRANELALQNALNARSSVSQAETNAFLNAQNRVIGLLQQYMDQSDWFKQNPVPPAVRGLVNGILTNAFGKLAQDLKDGLNTWTDTTPTPDESLIVGTIGGIGMGANDPAFDDIVDYDTRPAMLQALTQARSIARGQVLAMGGPFGAFISVCEAMWGRTGCTSSGATLSTWERVVSGLGGAMGTGAFWHELSAFAAMGRAGDRLASVSTTLSSLSLQNRVALVTELGDATIGTLDSLGPEAFEVFTNSARTGSSELLTSSATASSDALNAPFLAAPGGQPPFVPGTNAILGTSTSFTYVRFYSQAAGELPTGRFFTLASEVKGLTPAQIADRLALKNVPDTVVTVNLPAGEPIAIGTAAGTDTGNSWGAGGGFQVFWNKWSITWAKVESYFTNARPIGATFSG